MMMLKNHEWLTIIAPLTAIITKQTAFLLPNDILNVGMIVLGDFISWMPLSWAPQRNFIDLSSTY
jgi:hypothetical protein